jgi:hypothetical protein
MQPIGARCEGSFARDLRFGRRERAIRRPERRRVIAAVRLRSMPTIGFLHTADVHVATFRALVAEIAPGTRDIHVVDARALDDTRRFGIVDSVRDRITTHLRTLALEADLIVCTCSTLAGEAEILAKDLVTPVMRIDRPMAQAAMRAGGRVTVVAAVESTLEPTRKLLQECSDGLAAGIVLAPCLHAWPLFEAGDFDGYGAVVAEHVRRVAAQTDVIVLAQASMAMVEPLVADLHVPILSSPRLGVETAVQMATAASSGRRERRDDVDRRSGS